VRGDTVGQFREGAEEIELGLAEAFDVGLAEQGMSLTPVGARAGKIDCDPPRHHQNVKQLASPKSYQVG
jgi:hypothetical protein